MANDSELPDNPARDRATVALVDAKLDGLKDLMRAEFANVREDVKPLLTLVVDVGNNNSKALFGRWGDFASENVHIVERYVFDQDGKRFNYVAAFTDPTVYSRSWTATIPIKRFTEADQPDDWHFDVTAANRPGKPLVYEHMERTCVENNGTLASRSGAPAQGPIISR